VFVGDNGQGKTNLLEAIFVVSTLRSFRTSKLTDLIGFGRDRATIGARVLKDELTRVYQLELSHDARKVVTLDGKAVRPLSRYFGAFNVVVFTPEDLGLPRGSPGDRRRFLDRSVFTYSPEYLAVAADYDKVVRTRNAVLKKAGQAGEEREGRPAMPRRQLDDLLAVYDQQLAVLAMATLEARLKFLAVLAPELRSAFASITRTTRVAGLRYQPRLACSSVEQMLEQLQAARAKDLATSATQVGPHRDDIVLEIDGHEAGSFASQGQLRAIMLAWKTAELLILGRTHGDLPILLLDDVSSELDASRNEFLFEHLAKLAGQCFITTTDGGHVLVREHRADYRIQNGRISL
jgi:DNA replication and repair protein RecF